MSTPFEQPSPAHSLDTFSAESSRKRNDVAGRLMNIVVFLKELSYCPVFGTN